ncbi:hypothetical protein LMH87_009495 [Akanthomyces muscarius]|uniref:Rhodopsin domain-containing protein n=1 Tax=Akanthomyces muscarius TaxID=2231603 RepID=A0A9W8ULY2_AKAMU|nr:hypothetical protein LMH87_009495 [Akanthomyces muscarius]KAJ4152980.1 hypothetical protein LMH87_009495 [Akanthomyces muscarius]
MALTSRGVHMIVIVSVLVFLATLAVVMRLLARKKLRMKLGSDDYLCVVALVCLWGMMVELALWCTIGGNGSHIWDLDTATKLNFGKIFLSNQFTYFILCPALRLSIVCFYRRLFTTRTFQRVSTAIMWIIGLWGAAIFLVCALQCRPLAGYWDKSIKAQCIDGNQFFIVNQIFNVIMDFVLLALPLPIILRLNRSWADRFALAGVFALGGFVCFASIFRIVVLFYIDADDTTYTVYQATLWTHIEPSVGMVCCCLPSIRGLFPAFRFTKSSSQGTGSKFSHGASANRDATGSAAKSQSYFKMQDIAASRAESEEDLVPLDGLSDSERGITVQTDIVINNAPSHLPADEWRGAVRMEK